ncbi:MAG TPA: FAD-dependent monooxygenase [Burkholderiales bacterium]|nr:FAD-dependent monooxygenase [Burkholderiales bacterium]
MTGAADVLVLGAGPVGCTFARALRGSRHAVRLVDPHPAPPAGFRPIALSHASRLILERIGAWGTFPATPIAAVHVSQRGAFGRTRLEAGEASVPALGYVASYADVVAALRASVSIEQDEPQTPVSCTVHAEGADAGARERGYAHEALVARVSSDPGAGSTAYERFTDDGPLALLPLGADWAVIWAQPAGQVAARLDGTPAAFIESLQRAFGDRAGRFTAVHERTRAPLALRVRRSRVEPGAVYIGNAAQTLHPVAGQGLNLGLRDAWDLAQLLHDAEDPGEAAVLRRFAMLRRADALATIGVTEVLARGFAGRSPLARALRGAALTGLDLVPPARRFFARRMIFGPSALP